MLKKMVLKKFLLFSLFSTIVFIGFAQSNKISGKVIDADNNNPVVGASIVIEQSKKGTNSDAEGVFFLVIPNGKVNISVSSVGYTPKVLSNISTGSSGQTIVVALQRASSQLSNVTVRSSGTRRETISSLYLQQKNSSS